MLGLAPGESFSIPVLQDFETSSRDRCLIAELLLRLGKEGSLASEAEGKKHGWSSVRIADYTETHVRANLRFIIRVARNLDRMGHSVAFISTAIDEPEDLVDALLRTFGKVQT